MRNNRRIVSSYIIVIAIYLLLIPFLIVFLGKGLNRLLGWGPLLPSPYHTAAGIISLAYGWFWIIWSQFFLTTRGGGHPNEILGRELAPTTRRIVREGPYRFTRNPMAYGLTIFYFIALAFLFNITAIVALFPPACLFEIWYHKKYEEPGLLKRFGKEYEDYRKRVPLLFPFMKRLG